MSPAQLDTLQHLSRLFEEGVANLGQIKELSELLATINRNRDNNELEMFAKLSALNSTTS